MESALGRGSTFTLTLPLAPRPGAAVAVAPPPLPAAPLVVGPRCDDDRDTLSPKDETILIVEDDVTFARIVRDAARRQGFKCLVAADGPGGLELARRYRPSGIVLDVGLPGMDGWTVMETLKRYPATRHIPVHFVSATDDGRRGLEMGAVGFLTKPVSREQIAGALERIHHFATPGTRRLLLVEDDAGTRKAVDTLLAAEHLSIAEATTGEEAIARLRDDGPFDCMILDLGLPGMDGQTLLRRCAEEGLTVPPVVVYSARELSDADTFALSVDARVCNVRPAVDVLFAAAADAYRERLAGVVLTGANADSARGLRAIAEAGGVCLVQDPDTAAADAMPRAALAAVAKARVLSLPAIAAALIELAAP